MTEPMFDITAGDERRAAALFAAFRRGDEPQLAEIFREAREAERTDELTVTLLHRLGELAPALMTDERVTDALDRAVMHAATSESEKGQDQ